MDYELHNLVSFLGTDEARLKELCLKSFYHAAQWLIEQSNSNTIELDDMMETLIKFFRSVNNGN